MAASSTSSPLLYEIYTRQWLHGLSTRKGREIDLWGVPEDELDTWARRGFTHIWLMGMWPTGGKSKHEALNHPELRRAYDDALPGWTDADVGGSPYAVSAYAVPPSIGGDDALKALRGRMAERGIKLILDLVPNHTGLDHKWAMEKPHHYVGSPTPIPEAIKVRGAHGDRFIAHGKDPYFAGWTDTLQIDYRRRETRDAMVELIDKIAARCDGVRCDMAMLLLNDVFAKTWAHVPAMDAKGAPIEPCTDEFWSTAIGAIKHKHPGFLFLAEAYWDLEDRLCNLGFDYAYDKRLYDLVMQGDWGVAGHLRGLGPKNARRAHFLENHDEPRVNGRLPLQAHKAAALLTLSLPGLRFLHDGQLEGRRRFARIQLNRTAIEEKDNDVEAMYAGLFEALLPSRVGHGACQVLDVLPGWEGNPTHNAFTILQWQRAPDGRATDERAGDERAADGADGPSDGFDIVVVNHAPHQSQCWVKLSARGLAGGKWTLQDRLSPERWEREGDDLHSKGLFLDVAAHGAQLFAFTRV